MLTIRTLAHVASSRHRRGANFCRTSTGLPNPRARAAALTRDFRMLVNAETRRHWLEDCWRIHRTNVKLRQEMRHA